MKWTVQGCVAAGMLLLGNTVAVAENSWSEWCNPTQDTTPGVRQKHYAGRVWPFAPRPQGPADPLVHRFHNAHYWPDPFRIDDRQFIRTAFATQRENGWLQATTLYEQHFDPLSHELNLAGRRHLRWILQYTPTNRRCAWVAASDIDAISQLRLAAAQREADRLTRGRCSPVMLRDAIEYGTPAEEIDTLRRTWLTTMPAPRLPPTSAGASAAAGGASPQPQGSPQGGSGGSQ